MEPPKVDGRLKDQRNNARKPSEEEGWTEDGDPYLEDTLKAEKAALAKQGKKPRPTASQLAAVKVQEALALRAEGWALTDIAEALEVGVSTVTGWFTKHRRRVAARKVERDLDAIAVPLATENLIHGLLAGDKDYTLETLKGRGQFRRHVAGEETVRHELPPLVIRFEGAPGSPVDTQNAEKLVTGQVVGRKALPPGPGDTTRTELDQPIGVGVPSRPTADGS